MQSGWLECCGLILLAALAGCSPAGNTSQVQGQVTLDGQPVASGTISFTPVDGQATTAGGPITSGSYSVQVPRAAMKVSISSPKVIGKRKAYNTPDSPEINIMGEAVPARYNEKTELQLDVKPGVNKQDYPLQSK